jgi:hypothetical protein
MQALTRNAEASALAEVHRGLGKRALIFWHVRTDIVIVTLFLTLFLAPSGLLAQLSFPRKSSEFPAHLSGSAVHP